MPFEKHKFKFIDLFAGIGGFHIALHDLGGECVFASEMDSHARKTYEHNFKKISPSLFENNMFNDDIRKVDPHSIPDFDVLCAGFPCQPFSQAGYKRGFNDNHSSERGNLFFNIAEILDAKRPKAFFLENVRGIVNHDNGKTFKVIRDIIENELGYSFYSKVIYASDYGLPQHRPRAFMIGFKDETLFRSFTFPPKTPLKFTMDDVWGGKCNKKIGFTLRVGGRGSKIDDRRNWDSYYVNGIVKRISPEEGKKMQGFPDHYEFPVSETQAMKQLGNSVAVDAITIVARNLIGYMNLLKPNGNMENITTKNKGEWSELLTFVKLLNDKRINLSDSNLNPKGNYLNISKVTTKNIDNEFIIIDDSRIKVVNTKLDTSQITKVGDVINPMSINKISKIIRDGKGTFEIPEFNIIQDRLGFSVVKGGNSNQKSDIVLSVNNDEFEAEDEGFGIKSFLGSPPTLLNASGNTNFIFKVTGIKPALIDEINAIDGRSKIRDRINFITQIGGNFVFTKCERETMDYNLKLTDSLMPEFVSKLLISYYRGEGRNLSSLIKKTFQKKDQKEVEIKFKRLLVNILLGFFAGKEWDGNYYSNGTIILKSNGSILGFHVFDLIELKEYLFKTIKFDTPSSSRHRFGKLYMEKNEELYFKLNLQLRFTSN